MVGYALAVTKVATNFSGIYNISMASWSGCYREVGTAVQWYVDDLLESHRSFLVGTVMFL